MQKTQSVQFVSWLKVVLVHPISECEARVTNTQLQTYYRKLPKAQ
jgi:hypothetical protein